MDTRYDGDQKNLKKRSVKDAIRAEFSNGDVRLAILALPADKTEAAFQAEFMVVNDLKPSGKFIPVPKEPKGLVEERVRELTAWLRNGLNPRVRFALEPLDGQDTSGDLTAGSDIADNWYKGRLEPGTYRFQMSGAQDVTRTVRLQRGDRLLLELMEGRERDTVELNRHWYADTAPGVKSGKPTDPWRLTFLLCRTARRQVGSGCLPPLRIDRRRWTPFQYRGLAMSGLKSGRYCPTRGRSRRVLAMLAPGWPGLELVCGQFRGWPVFPGGKAGASPLLEAWWSPGGAFPAKGAWIAPAGMPISSLTGQSATIGDTPLTLDSIAIEEQTVDGKPEPQKCLVVRLSHPVGNPVWVRPQGTTATGSEVRVYRAANKVTCIFWGIDASKVTGFDVVVLNDALQRAKEL